jgi:hypothetical protein
VSARDSEWDDLWAEAKHADIHLVAEGLGAKLKRNGADWIGPCPAGCAQHDGFVISPAKRLFLCRPSGATGDAVDMVQHVRGCDKLDALREVTGRLPARTGGSPPSQGPTPRGEPENPTAAAEARAQSVWREEGIETILKRARPIAGTHAESYLAARCGSVPARRLTADLKFVSDLDYWSGRRRIATLPAMVAIIRNAAGDPIGIHQTYLDPAAPVKWIDPTEAHLPTKERANRAKKIRGHAKGGLIRLGRIGDKLAVGEGIETTLRWYARAAGAEDVTIACGVGLENMAGGCTGTLPHPTLTQRGKPARFANGDPDFAKPGMVLPEDVRELTLLGDGDSEPLMTRGKIAAAARRAASAGLVVNVHFAPEGKDWADIDPADEAPPVESAAAFLERIAADFKAPFRSQFGALFLDQLDEPGPEFEWLIDGWMSCGDRSIIGGASQSGKSFLAVHAALSIAHDREFFGAKVKPGLVVYQAGEGVRAFKRRLRAWRKHHGVLFSRETPFVFLQSPVDLWRADGDTPKLIEEINGIAEQYPEPLRLVVIDTLATATVGADEVSGRDMGLVMANVAKIGAATGAAVSLVHHLNAGGERLRGHTSIFANIDQVIIVTKDELTGVRTARLDKLRDGDETGATFSFELMSVGWGDIDPATDKPITSCVCLPVGQKEAIRRGEEQKGFKLEDDEVVFMTAYFKAEERYGEPVPPDMDLPHDVRSIVSYTAVKRAYLIASPSDLPPAEVEATEEETAKAAERHREALKKRLQRLRERLTKLNVIGVAGDRIWWTGKALRAFPQTMARSDEAGDEGGSDIPF